MTTSKQEQIYNEIVQYYDFADKLIDIVENNKGKLSSEHMEILESTIEDLENYTDKLTTKFIEFVKNGSSQEVKDTISQTLNEIIFKIEQCRNQIYELCNVPDQDPETPKDQE